MDYTIYGVEYGADDKAIKKQLDGRVLVTRNGRHFSSRKDLERYNYGLVWITSTGNDAAVAKKVDRAIMRANFARTLHQVVKV